MLLLHGEIFVSMAVWSGALTVVPTFTEPFHLFRYTQQLVRLPLPLCKAACACCNGLGALHVASPAEPLIQKAEGQKELICHCFRYLRRGWLQVWGFMKLVVMIKVVYEFKSWIWAGVLVSSEAWSCSTQVLVACHGYIKISVSTFGLYVSTVHKQS